MKRSSKPEVRNPLLSLPGFKRLQRLPASVRADICAALLELRDDARTRAEKAWRGNKGPMAAYWKSVGVYANHAGRVVKKG